jgi:hypothetical protein
MKNIAKWVLILWSAFCFFGVLYGMTAVGDQMQKGSDAAKAGTAIGAGCGMAMWVVIWAALALPALIIWLVAGKKKEPTPVLATDSSTVAKLCTSCGKYYDGTPSFCPNCGNQVT